jgi:hypothetical protein
MIIWIASYPKSGNTWIRALISYYLYSKKEEFDFKLLKKIPKFIQRKFISPVANLDKIEKDPLTISEFWESAQIRLNLDNEIKFFKTHNACVSYDGKWFADKKNSAGYIYLVRDPRSVVCSYASHFNISLEKALKDLSNENKIGIDVEDKMAELVSSWRINYQSWKKKKDYPGIVIRYEDLIDNTEKEFKKILVFLEKIIQSNLDMERIKQTIKACEFLNLRKMEDALGFDEAVNNNKFFRKGQKDSWKDELNSDLRKKIEKIFKDEMIELGYL